MRFLELKIRGEVWVRYPYGMRFPKQFYDIYPFRGRGYIAKILYILNLVCLDRLLLKVIEFDGLSDVAYFWPSSKRSCGRFYGYKVEGDNINEYLKFATEASEQNALRREVENVAIAEKIADGYYCVPHCRYLREEKGVVISGFDPLPENACTVPLTDDWYRRVNDARRHICKAGYMHGDFTWHNFKAVDDKLWIFDWEEMSQGGNSLSDQITLDYGLAYYWRKEPLQSVLLRFRSQYQNHRWDEACEAVKDLARRRITIGDILKEVAS